MLSPEQFGIKHDPDPPAGMWGRGPRHNEDWQRATTRNVPIASLVATQTHLNADVLDQYRAGKASRSLPRVANEGGVDYLIDGHHRAAVAAERGETHIRSRYHQS